MKKGVLYSEISSGYVMLEIVIALGLFATVAVSLTKALDVTSRTAFIIQDEVMIDQILQSALTDALSNPVLEESLVSKSLTDLTGDDESFFAGEIETLIEPLELESEEGKLLPEMFRIKVTFYWTVDNEIKEQSAETWRYNKLYVP